MNRKRFLLASAAVIVAIYTLTNFERLIASANSSLTGLTNSSGKNDSKAGRSKVSANSLRPKLAAANQDGLWREMAGASTGQTQAKLIRGGDSSAWPARYRMIGLNRELMQRMLAQTPQEDLPTGMARASVVTLPLPNGSYERFQIVDSPIMAPELAAQFPEIKTYRGQGIDDPAASMRFVWSPSGLSAVILGAGDTVYVHPTDQSGSSDYISYYRQDAPSGGIKCSVAGQPEPAELVAADRIRPEVMNGTSLRTLRLAVAATAEFTAMNGGTTASALAAIMTAVSNATAIFEREIAVRLVLVPQEASIIYTNAANQPYTNSSNDTMLAQNQTNIDNLVGDANYDIGYVFGTVGGGIASTGSAGMTGFKARGASGFTKPVGADADDLVTVPHEMAHQFSARHSFNAKISSCMQRDQTGAIEPGSASTIMGYAGACGAANLQPVDDSYFNTQTLSEMLDYVTNSIGTVGVASATGNRAPVVTVGPTYTVPSRTPFTLTAQGSDPDGDAITFDWEEVDRGATAPPDTDDGTRPIFRSYLPVTSPSRTFPSMQYVLNNANNPPLTYSLNDSTYATGEALPTTTRTMNFRVTVRDNRTGGGGIADASEQVNVRADAGPFNVTQPNTAVSWNGGSTQTVTWNVANTDQAPISVANVRILLSTDGGLTFPAVVAAGVPNNGSASIVVPNIGTDSARIRVEAVGNIFFDVSDTNFSIVAVNPQGPDLGMGLSHMGNFTVGANGVYNLSVTNVGTGNTTGPITVTDSLPVGLSFVSGIGTGWACLAAGQAVTCTNPGPIAPGANSAITLTVNVTNAAAGSAANSATVTTAGDLNQRNNTATDTTLSCAYSLNSSNTTFDPGGFNSGIGVSATAGCSWTAISNVPWLNILSGSPGAGNGTVMYEVKANDAATTSRNGTMTIAGQTFTVAQNGDPTAVIIGSINPTSIQAGSADLTITVNGTNFDPSASVAILKDGAAGNYASKATTFVNQGQLRAVLQAADLTVPVLYRVRVFGAVKQSGDAFFTVTPQGVAMAGSAKAAAGSDVTVTSEDFTEDLPWVEAEVLNENMSSGVIQIEAETFSKSPISRLMPDVGGGFVGLQVTGADASDVVQADLFYRQAVTDADKSLLRLWYFDGANWRPVRSSGGAAPAHNIVGETGGSVTQLPDEGLNSSFSVVFDSTSTPKVTDLTAGTVFTFAISQFGDLNGDDQIDASDLVLLANVLAGNVVIDGRPADVFLDGAINAADLVTLANYLAGNINNLPVVPLQTALSPAQPSSTVVQKGVLAPHKLQTTSRLKSKRKNDPQ